MLLSKFLKGLKHSLYLGHVNDACKHDWIFKQSLAHLNKRTGKYDGDDVWFKCSICGVKGRQVIGRRDEPDQMVIKPFKGSTADDEHGFCRSLYNEAVSIAKAKGKKVPTGLTTTYSQMGRGSNRQYLVEGSGGFKWMGTAHCSAEAKAKAVRSVTNDSLSEITFQGLPITIENKVGSVRRGEKENGEEWKVKFLHPYGFIQGTLGRDNEEIDVFVGADEWADRAYIIRQRIDGMPDEDKVFLGFSSPEEAKNAYLKHVDSPELFGGILVMPLEEFKLSLRRKEG